MSRWEAESLLSRYEDGNALERGACCVCVDNGKQCWVHQQRPMFETSSNEDEP